MATDRLLRAALKRSGVPCDDCGRRDGRTLTGWPGTLCPRCRGRQVHEHRKATR